MFSYYCQEYEVFPMRLRRHLRSTDTIPPILPAISAIMPTDSRHKYWRRQLCELHKNRAAAYDLINSNAAAQLFIVQLRSARQAAALHPFVHSQENTLEVPCNVIIISTCCRCAAVHSEMNEFVISYSPYYRNVQRSDYVFN